MHRTMLKPKILRVAHVGATNEIVSVDPAVATLQEASTAPVAVT